MANEEVLGPRKTMFVLVIVVGCFAVLWPRILSPLIMGPSREQLKPNQFDREAGCCEVLFDKDMAIMELLNEVCSSVTHTDKLSPYSAAECRRTVNETCGVDIAAYLKRSDNVGKTSKMLVATMKNSNSSCLREHFGVPVWNLGPHMIQNSWTQQDTLKQERPLTRGAAPHPALRERGRAIPPGVPPPPPTRGPVAMPPHARVRTSPLSVYYELDIKPPPIPGMRPPLGSPGGPVPAPKSSMGFVMPIYTICIIVFFVYTLSKILFKRTGTSPYEPISPDPQFRRRVFRDDSRSSPDKLVVTAISGLVAEVQQQMEASYAQNQQRQDVQQDNHARPYTNGTILHNSGPVHIVASEYQEPPKEKITEEKEISPIAATVPEAKESDETSAEYQEPPKDKITEEKDISPVAATIPQAKESDETSAEDNTELELDKREPAPELVSDESKDDAKESEQVKIESTKEFSPEPRVETESTPDSEKDVKETTPAPEQHTRDLKANDEEEDEEELEEEIIEDEKEIETKILEGKKEVEKDIVEEEIEEEEDIIEEDIEIEKENELEKKVSESEKSKEELENATEKPEVIDATDTQIKATAQDVKVDKNGDIRKTEEFLHDETNAIVAEKSEKQSTPELLEDAIKDEDDDDEKEKSSVKVVGMEITAHSADGGACGATNPAAPAPRPLSAPAPPVRAHEAESVQSIYLATEIPQQSRVLVADFAEDRAEKRQPTKHSPMVVSGKMTLSLIPDEPRETPERDQESTVDEFTTASAITQNAAEKQGEDSDEEIEEEIEIEEIEEEVEEEEEEEEVQKPKELKKAQ